MTKRIVAVLTALVLTLAAALPVFAAEPSGVSVTTDVQVVADLGILQGDGDGVNEAYLAKTATRLQAAILFLRLKGLEKEALAFQGKETFADANKVGDANQPVLAYLKAHAELGWTGTGDNQFEPMANITAQQFYKVLAETLGYKQDIDFQYEGTIDFVKTVGLSRIAGAGSLRNGQIAVALVESLKAKVKGGKKSLAEALVDLKVVSKEKAELLTTPRVDLVSGELGTYLVDGQGKTLYLFTKDSKDKSACADDCVKNWPIFFGESLQIGNGLNPLDFGTITRDDGQKQTTYKGMPLYYFVKDQKAGDTTGQGVKNVWFVIKPDTIGLGESDSLGQYLTDASGRTLYLYSKDVAGDSVCYGKCEVNWPIYYNDHIQISSGLSADDFGTITRTDGTKQTTYRGWPLYYFVKDMKSGDTTGEAVGGVWFVLKTPPYTVTLGTKDDLGNYLADGKGMTLYYYTKDTADVSNCSGNCLKNWPAFYSPELVAPSNVDTSDFGVITREDGSMQNTFKGMPLYYFVKDKQPGDTVGQDVNKVWYVIDPATFEGAASAAAEAEEEMPAMPEMTSHDMTHEGMMMGSMNEDANKPAKQEPEEAPKEQSDTPAAQEAQTASIDITNFAFGPESLSITAGTTVTFTNQDDVQHTATAKDGSFDSGLLAKGESFTYTFEKPGTYNIYCKPHPFMTATITVK